MKFKKILIIILSVALLSCFAVSTFATDASTVATIPDYGFYISPGDYVFNQVILDDSSIHFVYDVYLDFRFTTLDGYLFDSMQFIWPGYENGQLYFNSSSSDLNLSVLVGSSWTEDSYRYITVLDGFFIYDINIYQWWLNNVTRVDSGYDDNLLDGILSSFTFIGQWIAGAANAVTPMFWDGEALTVVGTLSVAGLSFAVVFLLIALVSSFMKFRS